MNNLPGPPNDASEIGFTWFGWFKKLYTETLGFFKTDGSRDITGNVNLSGTGLRFTADMNNTTLKDRFYFQGQVINGNTALSALPNGTSNIASVIAFNNSDPTNSNWIRIQANATEARIDTGLSGTGLAGTSTYAPLGLYTSNVKQVEINAAGTVTFTNDAYVGANKIYHEGNLSPGGNLKSQLLTTADSSPWTWPAGVDEVWITMVGGGAGGRLSDTSSLGGGGGGAGEYVVRYPFPRLSATTTTFTVGVKGNADNDGQPSVFGTLSVQGGKAATTVGYGGKGGGDLQTAPSSKVTGVRSVDEGILTFSGANGGGAGIAVANNGYVGGGCEMYAGGTAGTGGTRSGGGGGGSSLFGQGGAGGNQTANGSAPSSTAYGAGGGGSGGTLVAGTGTGGAGMNGCILLEWIGA